MSDDGYRLELTSAPTKPKRMTKPCPWCGTILRACFCEASCSCFKGYEKCPTVHAKRLNPQEEESFTAEQFKQLPHCQFCRRALMVVSGHAVNTIIACMECVLTHKEKCMYHRHYGERHVLSRTVELTVCYSHLQATLNDPFHARVCVNCRSKYHLLTVDEHECIEARKRGTGEVIPLDRVGSQQKLIGSPWDAVGGLRNRWQPAIGKHGIGETVVFRPLWPTTIQLEKRQLTVMYARRALDNNCADGTPCAVVHSQVMSYLNAKRRSPIITSEARHVSASEAKVMAVGWTFVYVVGALADNSHVLFMDSHRISASKMGLHESKYPLGQWVEECTREAETRKVALSHAQARGEQGLPWEQPKETETDE